MELQELRSHVRERQSIDFLDAWLRWRGQRLLPKRADVSLRDVLPFIDRIMLFELAGPDDIRVRVAGTAMRDLVGAEMSGKDFRQFSSDDDWRVRSYRFMTIASVPCGSYTLLRDVLPSGRSVLYEIIQLPVDADEPTKPRQLLSSNMPIERVYTEPLHQERRVVPLPIEYRFIDIGAGAPTEIVPS